jgi:hypothetical protein
MIKAISATNTKENNQDNDNEMPLDTKSAFCFFCNNLVWIEERTNGISNFN